MPKISMDSEGPRCSVERSLEILGEKWSLLIVREALDGVTRFADFQARLGIPTPQLSARLKTLTASGIFDRVEYREVNARPRYEYTLTTVGRDLKIVMAAMMSWGDRYRTTVFGPSSLMVDSRTGETAAIAVVSTTGDVVPLSDVEFMHGPGFLTVEERIEARKAVRGAGS